MFKGTQTGLVLDNNFVTNKTDLDFVNSDVRYLASIDKNIDGVNDIYILTPDGSIGLKWELKTAQLLKGLIILMALQTVMLSLLAR